MSHSDWKLLSHQCNAIWSLILKKHNFKPLRLFLKNSILLNCLTIEIIWDNQNKNSVFSFPWTWKGWLAIHRFCVNILWNLRIFGPTPTCTLILKSCYWITSLGASNRTVMQSLTFLIFAFTFHCSVLISITYSYYISPKIYDAHSVHHLWKYSSNIYRVSQNI